jgi:Subtilase family
MDNTQKYVVAPRLSVIGKTPSASRATALVSNFSMVSDSKKINENDPVVVEMTREKARESIKSHGEDVIITRFVKYDLALAPIYPPHVRLHRSIQTLLEASSSSKHIKFKVTGSNNEPVPETKVVAFLDFRQRWGAEGTTNGQGEVTLEIPSGTIPNTFEATYVYAPHSYWSVRKVGLAVTDQQIQLTQLPETSQDEWWSEIINVPEAHNNGNLGKDVKVAIVDTGVGPHRDLNVIKGQNFTTDGTGTDYKDVEGHGSHVAGIIAANGKLHGIAPDAQIHAARVFPKQDPSSEDHGASNADIAAAIQYAIDQWQCDVLNLSLGGQYDPLTEDRINYATARGALCVAAAGNSAGTVEFPGALDNSFCVAAVGQSGRYPQGTVHQEAEPESRGLFGKDNLFAASFSCRGPQVDICAPGVSVISTVPVDKYAALDGTSMAAPVVSGLAALVIGRDSQIRISPKNGQKINLTRSRIASLLEDIHLPTEIEGSGFTFT